MKRAELTLLIPHPFQDKKKWKVPIRRQSEKIKRRMFICTHGVGHINLIVNP